jgi:hypothetical protein
MTIHDSMYLQIFAKIDNNKKIISFLTILFPTVSDSSVNSWESWFIFNLRKINAN